MIEGDIVEHGAVELQNIVPTVVIVVQKLHRDSTEQHCLVSDARIECVIGESAILVVVVQTVQLKIEMGNVNVLPSIAVYVAGVNTHTSLVPSIFAGGQPGNERHIFEC